MQEHHSTARIYFTLYVSLGFLASLSLHQQGALCVSLTCKPPSRLESVQELVLQSGVVVEGWLQEDGQESGINAQRIVAKVNESLSEVMNDQIDDDAIQELVTNRSSELKPPHVRVRVHQVWEIKAGGLAKDSIVSLLWSSGDNCVTLSADTRYMFFMEPTNDTSVFIAAFPPVETRRAVRKNVSRALCQTCVEPKLKPMKTKGTVDEGRRTALSCELEAGSPLPKIKWYKDAIEIAGKNKPKNTKIKKKKGGRVSELQFKNPREADSGTYRCEAANNLGKDSVSGNLTVISRAVQSTTPSVRTISSHMTPCNESEKAYCVNGGECLTLEVTYGSSRKLCRCLREYTGDRCQDRVAVRVISQKQAEELYQKRVLTITGICIALLVVGIMCVVAYCKTKKQRQKLHDRLRQSLRERNAMASMANGPQTHTPHPHPPPPENIQLVNQYISKSAAPAKHVIEKERETSFTLNQYTSPTHQSATVTHSPSHSWMNSKHEQVASESRSAPMKSSSMEAGSRHATPSHRGRLNGTGGTRDLAAYLKSTRETAHDSNRDSPYSERYVSAMTSPTHLSQMELLSPMTPGSPPSEMSMSAPLSSLATSIPSVAVSPSVDEDRPLLFLTPPRPRDKQRVGGGGAYGHHGGACAGGGGGSGGGSGVHQCSKRNSAHYNHGQDPSPPPSPLHILEDDEYESTQEYEAAAVTGNVAGATVVAIGMTPSPSNDTVVAMGTSPTSPSAARKKFRQAAAAVAAGNKRTKPNGVVVMMGAGEVAARQAAQAAMQATGSSSATAAAAEAAGSATAPPSESESSQESSSSDESETEDERVAEATPFLSLQNPSAAAAVAGMAGVTGVAGGLEGVVVVGGGASVVSASPAVVLRSLDGSRTNPALRLSPQEDLQVRLSNVMTNQDPIAV